MCHHSFYAFVQSKNKVQDFKILHNYIPSDVQQNVEPFTAYNDTVTYTTQASYDFLQHSIELCRRFDGPISLAVYCPGTEFLLTVRLIHRLRQCDHSCVRNNISWHLVFDHQYRPDLLNEQQTWHQFLINNEINTSTDCTEPYSVFSDRLIGQYFPNKSEHNNVLNFRTQKGLPYPINVLRNAARQSASTRYVLASDIELYPSLNVVSMFGKLLARERANQLSLVDSQKPHVYVLPIFEVKSTVKAPETKSQLISMLTSGDAIPFHKWVCETCQQFVDREKWANETVNVNELNIFRKTRRYKSYWEPLYIGTNDEPFYEERINWDGKLDKMTQVSTGDNWHTRKTNFITIFFGFFFPFHTPIDVGNVFNGL